MYGFSVVMHKPFDAVIQQVTDALKTEGFGILTDIDVSATMKAKLGVDMPAYRILGACNPPLAHQAISLEPEIGLLLPCNVVVRETGDGTVDVGFMDPVAVLQLVERPEIRALATAVRQRLDRVSKQLVG